MNKTQMLNEMQAARAGFERLLAPLTDEQMTAPGLDNGWSIKDLLAHITFWEEHAAEVTHALLQGAAPHRGIQPSEVDEINAKVYAENRARPLADIRRDEQAAYDRLLALVQSASEDALFDPHRFDWLGGDPLYILIYNNSYGHYEEHWPMLSTWLESIHPQ